MPSLDSVDANLLLELCEHPRATTVALAQQLGIARNTAQARLARLETDGALGAFERRITRGARLPAGGVHHRPGDAAPAE